MSIGNKQALRGLTWGFIVPVYIVGLLAVACYFRNALNTDAVAYLRIASYYAEGKVSLALTGYWGPLLSWLMVPAIKAGFPLQPVARGAMALSALVFLGGCVAVFRAFGLTRKWLLTGAILSAACGLYWSVRFITPDLLLAGLVGLAMSRMVRAQTTTCVSEDFLAGALWGLAYLAKAVAFPLAILSTLSIAALRLAAQGWTDRVWLRRTFSTFLAFALVVAPWVTALSLKYRRPTFSTSARISHAVTGPADTERYHPFARTFHKPDPGRITSWEEPSQMGYRYWSPLASPDYAWYQLKIILRNIPVCLALLTSMEVAWLIPAYCLLAQIACASLRDQRWPTYLRLFIVPILLLALYLPASVNLAEQRFFYPAFPFLFAAVALWANESPQTNAQGPSQRHHIRTWWLGVLGVATPLVATVVLLGNSPKYAGDVATDLTPRIQRANLTGPIAGSGMLPGGRAGLYVAFLLNQPWFGDEPNPEPRRLLSSGARLVLVNRQSQLARALSQNPSFFNCDAQLFDNTQQAGHCPLQVYAVKGWSAGPSG